MDNYKFFTDNLKKEMVLDIKKMPKEQALNLLIKTMSKNDNITDTHSFKQAIISREMLMSTGIGNGFALPHARLDSIKNIKIGFARCLEGIIYESIDDKPVHFIIMVAAPKNYEKDHLKSMAPIIQKLKEKEIMDALLEAEITYEIYDLLISKLGIIPR